MISPFVSATTRDSGVASRKEPGVSTSESRPRAASNSVATGMEVMLKSSVGWLPHMRRAGHAHGGDPRAGHGAPLAPPAAGLERREKSLQRYELMEAEELDERGREEDEAVGRGRVA